MCIIKTNKGTLAEIQRLLNEYEKEVLNLEKSKVISHNTAKTYLLHSHNFVRWCKDEFIPGGRKI